MAGWMVRDWEVEGKWFLFVLVMGIGGKRVHILYTEWLLQFGYMCRVVLHAT